MNQSIIIIGAGIAGLSAGCYGQMNGYRTTIFELHDLPGGLCTSWKRKGYTFDCCIHWLCGSSPSVPFYRIWEELGAIQGRSIVDHEVYIRYEGKDGKSFLLYTDPDRLEEHMKALSPEDHKHITELTDAVRKCQKMQIPMEKPREFMNVIDLLKMVPKMLPVAGVMKKYMRMSLKEFAGQFKDPFLREALNSVFGLEDFPLIAMVMTLSMMANRGAGYPIGGSLEFARAIERRYLALGGKIQYRSRVAEILVEKDRAVGVRLADGTEYRADLVISAADGHATIFEMLGGKYINEEIREWYTGMPIFQSMIQVSLGINRDLSAEPHYLSFAPMKRPVIDGVEQPRMGIKNYCYDPTMAPQGKSVVEVIFASDISYWQGMDRKSDSYQAEKDRIAEQVIAAVEERFPGIREQIEVVDVATPLTMSRYTANWQGSMEGWLITTDTFTRTIDARLPGLDQFYMAGQWVRPGGGLPPAAQSGRDVIYTICRKDRKKFITAKP